MCVFVCVSNGFTCWVCVCVVFMCVSVCPEWRLLWQPIQKSGCVDFFCPLQVRRGQRTVQTETKYIELMVVNDHELVGVRLTAPRCSSYLCNCSMNKAIIWSVTVLKMRLKSAGALLIRLCNQHRKMLKGSNRKGSFSSSSLSLCSSVAQPLWRRTLPKLWWTWPMRWEHTAMLWKSDILLCLALHLSF